MNEKWENRLAAVEKVYMAYIKILENKNSVLEDKMIAMQGEIGRIKALLERMINPQTMDGGGAPDPTREGDLPPGGRSSTQSSMSRPWTKRETDRRGGSLPWGVPEIRSPPWGVPGIRLPPWGVPETPSRRKMAHRQKLMVDRWSIKLAQGYINAVRNPWRIDGRRCSKMRRKMMMGMGKSGIIKWAIMDMMMYMEQSDIIKWAIMDMKMYKEKSDIIELPIMNKMMVMVKMDIIVRSIMYAEMYLEEIDIIVWSIMDDIEIMFEIMGGWSPA